MKFGEADEAFRITNGDVNAGGVHLTTTLAVVPEKDGMFLDLRAAGLVLRRFCISRLRH